MSVSPQLRKRRLHHAQHGKVDAGHLNGNQAHMGEVQGTIWNAVRYPHTPHGRESWRVATEGTSERDWMVPCPLLLPFPHKTARRISLPPHLLSPGRNSPILAVFSPTT